MDKQALIELRDNVKAGDRTASLKGTPLRGRGDLFQDALNGSLDAAKKLHDVALGRSFNYSVHKDSASVMTWAHTVEGKTFSAIDNNPARAWLIAILSALIEGG